MVRRTALISFLSGALLSLACIGNAEAVQRSFMNLGFESPALNPDQAECPQAIWPFSTVMPITDAAPWQTDHQPMLGWCTNSGGATGWVNHSQTAPLIDIWKDGKVAGVPSRSGKQHAELNALVASRLYQTVCLVTGDNVQWQFSHRARGGVDGKNVLTIPPKTPFDKMKFTLRLANSNAVQDIVTATSDAEGNGSNQCHLGTCTSPGNHNNSWVDHSGSFSWTGASGLYEFSFEAVDWVTVEHEGNLLDDIQLNNLKPFVELSRPDYNSVEGAATDNRLALRVSGTFTNAGIPVDKTIRVQLIPVTADTADYGNVQYVDVVIPAIPSGGYDNQSFPFDDQITIAADALQEGSETFRLEIVPSDDFLIQSTNACGAAGNASAIYTINEAQLSLTKTATISDGNGDARVFSGDTINYTVTVTNSGSVPLTNVVVTDDRVTLSDGGAVATLAVGTSKEFTGSYPITIADMANGQVVNSASATAVATASNPSATVNVPPVTANHTQPLDVVRSLDFIKSVRGPTFFDDNNQNGYLDAGEPVWFGFDITNTGTLQADVTSVTDSLPGFVFQPSAPAYTLSPGQNATFSGYYPATQADIDSGEILNVATASYTAVGVSGTVTSRSPTGGPTKIEIPTPPLNSILKVTKDVTGTTIGADGPEVGDVLTYEIVVENIGNVTVRNLQVTDPLLGLNESGADLAPPASGNHVRTFGPYNYSLTQPDIDQGRVVNTASASGTIPSGQGVSASGSHTQNLEGNPEVDLLKEATFVNLVGSELPEEGDRIDFTFTVTNTGNVSITDYEITDATAVLTRTRVPPVLAGGDVDSTTYTGSRIITAADVNAGYLENVAYLNGIAASGEPVSAVSHGPDGKPTRFVFEQRNDLTATLQGEWKDSNGNLIADLGEVVDFTITITNTGNVTLSTADIAGMLPTAGLPEGIPGLKLAIQQQVTSLAAGQSSEVHYQHVLTQDDLDRGAIYAQVEVAGTGPTSMAEDVRLVRTRSHDPAVESTLDTDGDGKPDYPTVVTLPQLAKLQVQKTGRFIDTGPIAAGARILYEIVISNVGNVTVDDVYPVDNGLTFGGIPASGVMESFAPEPVTLAAGEKSPPFQAIYTVTETDVANAILNPTNGIANTASATGNTRNGIAPEVIPGEALLQTSWVTLMKKALMQTARVGELVTYSLELTVPESYGAGRVTVKDVLPPGFLYLPGSAVANGAAVASEADGNTVQFHDVPVAPGEPTLLVYNVRVGASVKPGEYQNRAFALDPGNRQRVSNEAVAGVTIASEAIFDCATILGRVFVDENRNGYYDEGERGLAGSTVSDISGVRITTDSHGRFSIPCVTRNVSRIGSSHLLKLDPRSLPTGYRIVTENPRHVRLSAGAVSHVEFGVSAGRVVRIDITAGAFVPNENRLNAEWQNRIGTIMKLLQDEPSILRIVYHDSNANAGESRARIEALRKTIETRWKTATAQYPLEIETTIVAASD